MKMRESIKDLYKKQNRLGRIVLLFMALVSLGVILLHIPPFSNLYVRFVESFVIHRGSQDPGWLIYYTLTILDGYWWLIVITVLALFFVQRSYFMFVVYSIFAFVYTNFYAWKLDRFKGYYSVWDYGDLVNSIVFGYGHGDCYHSNYPPFAVMIIKMLGTFLVGKEEVDGSVNYLVFLFSMLSMFILIMALVALLHYRKPEIDLRLSLLFVFCLMISGPVMFAYQRMNVSVLAVALIAVYVLLHDSDNKVSKHIGILAVAANLKYYPAVFGLMLLKKRKYKEAVIAFAEGILLFFIPILYDRHSMRTLSAAGAASSGNETASGAGLVSGLVSGSSNFSSAFLSKGGVSIKKMLYDLFTALGKEPAGRFFESIWWIILIVYMALTIYLALKAREDDHSLLLLTFACIFVPSISMWYAVELMLIPLALLLKRTYFNGTFSDKVEIMLYTFNVAYVMGYPKILNAYQYVTLLLLFGFVVYRCIREQISSARKKESYV